MATYTTITDASVDPQAPITSELMSALRDNPIAIAEQSTGAPRLTVAKRTLLYNNSGVVDAVESTDFEDGYYYRFIFEHMELNPGGTSLLDFMREGETSWLGTVRSTGLPIGTNITSGFFWNGVITIYAPRESAQWFYVHGVVTNNPQSFNTTFGNSHNVLANRVWLAVTEGVGVKIKRIRYSNTDRQIQSGKIWQEKLSYT